MYRRRIYRRKILRVNSLVVYQNGFATKGPTCKRCFAAMHATKIVAPARKSVLLSCNCLVMTAYFVCEMVTCKSKGLFRTRPLCPFPFQPAPVSLRFLLLVNPPLIRLWTLAGALSNLSASVAPGTFGAGNGLHRNPQDS